MNLDQLAAEATEELRRLATNYEDWRDINRVIKAACEKATSAADKHAAFCAKIANERLEEIAKLRASQEGGEEPKNFTKMGWPLPVLRCPYCGCKSLHEDVLTMCCQRAISETLRAAQEEK